MIKLFDSKETNFKHCKWVLSECTKALVTESVEGLFYLDLEYPLFDKKNISQYLIKGNIIQSPVNDDRPSQLFKIRKANKKTSDKRVVVYAEAIARADLDTNFVPGIEVPAGKTRKEACQMLLDGRVQKTRNYVIGNLDTNTNTIINMGLDENTGAVINYLDIAEVSPLVGFLDNSINSIYKAYGGELIFNNFELNMVDERGAGHKIKIKSGKNLEELEEEISDMDDDFATALIMKSADGLFLPNEEIIYSPNANKYDRYKFKVITCSDVSLVDDSAEAIAIVYAQLRERAQNYFNEGIDVPTVNYTINFVQLANTEEYKNYASLEKCELGNTVETLYEKIGISSTGRVIKTVINLLRLDRKKKPKIEEVEIGKKKQTIATTISNTQTTANNAATTAIETKVDLKKTKKKVTVRMDALEASIELSVTQDELWSLIEMNPRKILMAVNDEDNETDVTITPGEGLAVKNGKISIYNNDNDLMLQGNTKGSLSVRKGFTITDFSGSTDVELRSDGIYFYRDGYPLRGISINEDADLEVMGETYFGNKVDVYDLSIDGTDIDTYIRHVVSGT